MLDASLRWLRIESIASRKLLLPSLNSLFFFIQFMVVGLFCLHIYFNQNKVLLSL